MDTNEAFAEFAAARKAELEAPVVTKNRAAPVKPAAQPKAKGGNGIVKKLAVGVGFPVVALVVAALAIKPAPDNLPQYTPAPQPAEKIETPAAPAPAPVVEAPPARTCAAMQAELELIDAQMGYAEAQGWGNKHIGKERGYLAQEMIDAGCP